MIIIVYIILIFTAIQFLTVFVNYVFRQKLKYQTIKNNPLVSVLIPARNEEQNITNILNDLQEQSYKNIEIIVFDDNSTDKTAELVNAKKQIDNRIQIIKSHKLPENWLGKNWACHNLALKSKGDYLLFLDADVRLKPNLIRNTVSYSQTYNLSLLSIFPKQIMNTIGEKLTVPLMHFILTTLLPLILVRKSPFTSHSAANGQFMLFKSSEYHKYLPHKEFKSEKVEDIKISRFYKSKRKRIACLTGTDLISCRMYNNYNEAINGFSKNIVMFFGNSYFFAILFWAINTLGIVAVLIYSNNIIIALYLAAIILIRVFFSIVSKQNIFMNLLLFIPQMISMFVMVFKSLIYKFTKKQKWKGRYI